MQTIRDFEPEGDRYAYDFGPCRSTKGFAQIDTSQDAHYYGHWCSPSRLMIVGYCEGDVTIQTADDEAEFVAEIRRMETWHDENGHGPLRIDPGFNDDLKTALEALGLSDLLH